MRYLRSRAAQYLAFSALAAGLAACAEAPPDEGFDGPGVEVAVAALDLPGVGDVVWDVEVLNDADEVVWQRRLTSTGYGDGAGSFSYVGPVTPTARPTRSTSGWSGPTRRRWPAVTSGATRPARTP